MADFRWDLARKRRVVFLRRAGDPNAHYANIYGNNLKSTVALVMGQLLFLKRLRM